MKTLTSETTLEQTCVTACPRWTCPARGARSRGLTRGFTLVELLVVFALMALLVAVVPLAFDKLRDSAQYRETVRAMLTDLRTAKSQAMLHGREVRFVVNTQERTFGIDGATTARLPDTVNVLATVALTEIQPGGVVSIRFLPAGGASGGRIDLVRQSGGGTRLQVDWLSGAVQQEALTP